jgi:hypothetical protein
MPQAISLENNFVQGLRTEFTGLNFPENAATETFNCYYDRKGNVRRRLGFDYEANYTLTDIDRDELAISTYKWDNAGGDGTVEILVLQVGSGLGFYRTSSADTSNPISDQKLGSTVSLSSFIPSGGSFTATKECTYAQGNGYLFVFHPDMEPIYCVYAAGTITAASITLKIRDFTGAVDGLEDSSRPVTLSDAHKYNIYNQGWYPGVAWSASSTTSVAAGTGAKTWTIQTGLTISGGQVVTVTGTISVFGAPTTINMTGTVTSYNSVSGELVLNITSSSFTSPPNCSSWTFAAAASGKVETFFTAAGNVYPSNVDVWWRYKDSTGAYDPGTTFSNVSQFAGPAPKGRFILEAFNQNRSSISGVSNITTVSTTTRPRIGTWYQGRVWFGGVDAAFSASGTAAETSWTETIYFSQIIEKVEQFGRCYQVNDPTSEDLFDLLPTDGGTVRIQGCGQIFKLFPIQNGMLVFCANGIWFITGSQGIGFSANDYTVTKISGVQSSNSTSFVDVQGWPFFWNDEGIYAVSPGQQGNGISVENIAKKTILGFYQDIPLKSKQYARGDYDPINMIIQWCYRSTNESSTTTRYEFDRILCLNLTTGAFYPYSFSGTPKIHGVNYIQSPGGSTAPEPVFKYVTSASNGVGSYNFTFSEEKETDYEDWDVYGTAVDYTSYFITGYKLHGKAVAKVSPNYVYIFVNNETNAQYKIRGIWDYAIHTDSNRFSSEETATITASTSNFGKAFKRHRVRGHGYVLQFKVSSVAGQPFDIQGWSVHEVINQSV